MGQPSAGEVEAWIVGGRVDRLLRTASSTEGIAARRYVVDALERALLLADPGAISAATRRRAIELGVDPAAARPDEEAPIPPNGVLVPFATVDPTLTEPMGVVRMVYLALRLGGPGGPAGGLGAEATSAVEEAVTLAARHATPPRAEGRWTLTAAQPEALRALRVEGRSLGAATLVSAVATFAHRRVRPGTVVSGNLSETAVTSVGGLAAKLEGALEGREDVRRIVCPARNADSVRAWVERSGKDVSVVGVRSQTELLEAALEPGTGPGLEAGAAVAQARSRFERGWQGYRWPTQREPLERLVRELPTHRPDLQVEALTMLGAVTRHLGAPDESAAVLARAAAIAESEEGREAVPDAPLTWLWQHLSLTQRQICHFREAARTADRAVRVARRGRLRGELLKAHGCAGLVRLSQNRPDLAVRHQREALRLVHRHRPEGCPRTHGYLVEALGRAGDVEGSESEYRAGLRHLRGLPEGPAREAKEAWLRTAWAGVLVGAGSPARARRVLDAACVHDAIEQAPLPGLFARRWLGMAHATDGERARRGRGLGQGLELLASSVAAHGRGQLPHVRFLAHLNVLYEARLRLALGAWDRDVESRGRTALTHLPAYGGARAFLEPGATEVAQLLPVASYRPDRAARALDRLLSRCVRLV